MGSATTQGQLWGTNPRDWADIVEPLMAPLHHEAVTALHLRTGMTLLDAGCGTGAALQRAAAQGARVSGLDASAPMLDIARERVPDADLRVGDIESLPYDDGTFDVVTAFNAIQYATDPKNAVVELARVTQPGGRVVIGVWGDPARCETEAVFAAVRAVAPPPPGTPAPLAVSKPGVVEELLATAGLEVTGGAEVDCPFEYPDSETAWRGQRSGGPFRKAIEIAGEDAVRAAFMAAHKDRQDNVFRYVISQKR